MLTKIKRFKLKYYLSISVAIFLLTGNGCKYSYLENSEETIIYNVTPAQANELIKANQANDKFIIIDVRTAREYQEGHIANSINIDFYASTFKNQVQELNKENTYLIYCQSGNRSFSALDFFKELKFIIIYNLQGGLSRWINEGYPVTVYGYGKLTF